MISFHDLEKDAVFRPALELETTLQLPIKLVNEVEGTFMARLACDAVNLVLKNAIYRITREFRFRISPDVATSTRPVSTEIYSADKQFFDMMEQLLKLEPCFKIKPPADMAPDTLRELLFESSCRQGFLEISSFNPRPSFEEILINGPEIFKLLQLEELENINRILIYDIGKNCSIVSDRIPSGQSDPRFAKHQASRTTDVEQPPASNIHASLVRMILSYLEQKISTRFVQNMTMNREKIFRTPASRETLAEALKAIDKSLSLIKTDQHRHREGIKTLIASFYADNFAELNRLNLATPIEEFYTKL